MAALSRVLSQMMFNLSSLLILDSFVQEVFRMEWLQNRLLYIELVVVTVVGGGELVENSEKPCRNAGVLVSTGL